MIPKYSVVLPVLNGGETLPVVLKHLLTIDYEDFEVVVSDNLSSDNTAEILDQFNDTRLKVVRPERRLGWSENLAFAYSHANGMWQHHIGDDDVVLPSRFKILDQLIDLYPEADVLWSRGYRYHWPNYREISLANKMDAISFTGAHTKLSILVREAVIRGCLVDAGFSWIVSKNLIDNCIKKYGFYVSRQHGEAFGYRAALINSKNTVIVDLPLAISGRHQKSIGTQHLQSKEHYIEKGETDIAHSDPDEFHLTPWKYKGYTSWSLDALCLLISLDEQVSPLDDSEWLAWAYMTLGEIKSLRNKGQINHDDEFISQSLEKNHHDLLNIWRNRKFDCASKLVPANSLWPKPEQTRLIRMPNNLTSFPAMNVNRWNVKDISQLAYTIEKKLPIFYGHRNLQPILKQMNERSVLADKVEDITQNYRNGCAGTRSVAPLKMKPVHEKICKNFQAQYEKKYNEFETVLENYQFNVGNRCNPPVIMSYEFGDIKSINETICKQNRKKLPIPATKLINGSIEKYTSLMAKIKSMKGKQNNVSAIVIGNGPSQEMLDYKTLESFKNKGNHVYVVNNFGNNTSLLNCITHFVTADYKMFSRELTGQLAMSRDITFRCIDKFQPEVFSPINIEYGFFPDCKITYYETRHLHAWEGGGWEPDGPRRYWSNTLLFTLAITRFLGYKKVYVIGGDTSYPQCIRVAPDNELAMIESHACLNDRITQGYPLSSNMYKYMALLSYWFWSYQYICDDRFVNLDPLSLVDSIRKVDLSMNEGLALLNKNAQVQIEKVINRYHNVAKKSESFSCLQN